MMKKASVLIAGIAPGLMMGAMSNEQLLALPGGPGSAKKIQKSPDSKVESIAEAKIYRDNQKRMGIPAQNFFSMLKHAGRRVPYSGKSKVSTADSTYLTEFFRLLPPSTCSSGGFFPFENLDEKGEIKWEPDARRGVNKATDGAMCVIRPKFLEWKMCVDFEWDDEAVSASTIGALFKNASTGSGLCEFRPNCGGQFGQFTIEKWEGIDVNVKAKDVAAAEEPEEASAPVESNGSNRIGATELSRI